MGEANCIQSLGDVFKEEKAFALALQKYEQATDLYRFISPSNEAYGFNAIADLYDEQKDYPKAIAAYTRALELFPEHVFIWRNRAYQYLKLKDELNASQDIEQAARLQPDNAYLFLRRGQLALLRDEYDEALAHFQAALERYPRMNDAYFGIGLAHLRAGRPIEAREAYQQGLDLTHSASELDDPRDALAELRQSEPNLAGLEEIWKLVNEADIRKRQGTDS